MSKFSGEMSNGWEVIDAEEYNKYGLTKTKDEDVNFPIAIVGMGCRMAGVEDMRDYRKVLVEQLRTYGPVPSNRWSKKEWYSGPGPFKSGFTNNHTAGFIDELWSFDHTFFNTSPREAQSMDPQQYHVMEVSQEALDDAGVTKENMPTNTAVFMSMRMGEQTLVCAENRNLLNPYVLTGGAHTVTANRVNFFYDVSGPSMGVEGSCAAALHSVHFGLQALWNNECDAVLAGGINHILSPHYHLIQCDLGMLSTQEEAMPFEKDADGRIRAEGCGVIYMKPLADAERDGDHVHCVIRSSVLGYHGHNLGLTMHNSETVAKNMQKVYDQTGISPDKVDFVEASGTGHPDEDNIEAEALAKVFGDRTQPLKIGSCKANVGHSECASGMSQLIKGAMMLKNREFYPQPNFTEPHPNIPTEKLEVQQKLESCDKEGNMLVGVNSMAFSGPIVHMLLEEYTNKERDIKPESLAGWYFGVPGEAGRMVAVVLSAKSKAALKDMATRWLHYENAKDDAQIVAAWLASKRSHFSCRMIVFANSSTDFKEKIQDYINGQSNDSVIEGTVPPTFQQPKVCFVFPGQGQQWWDMGRALYANEPLYRDIVHQCDEIWKRASGYSFLEKNKIFVSDTTGVDPADIDQIIVCQPAILSHEIGLAVMLQHWGIKPDMVIGHSLGEVAASYVAGGLTLDEAITSIYHRAYTQTKLTGTGSMAGARLTPEEAEKLCEDYDDVFVACYNSTDNVTLAGTVPTLRKLADEKPKQLKIIRVQAAFHTILVRPVRDEFYQRMEGKYTLKTKTDVVMYSAVKKDAYPGPYDPKYWWTNIEEPVYFMQANKALFRDHGNDVVFMELASAATLLSSIRQTAKKLGVSPAGYVPCGARVKDDWVVAMKGLAQLYFMGFTIDWDNATKNCARYVQIPTYPFQRTQFQIESELMTTRRLGLEDKSYTGRLGQIDVSMHPFLADYKINGKATMPASGLVEYLMELVDEASPSLRDVEIMDTNCQVFEKDITGQYDKLFIAQSRCGDMITLQTDKKAWDLSPAQKDSVYAKAIINSSDVQTPTQLNISTLQSRCQDNLEPSTIYKRFAEAGLQYGEAFKVITGLSCGDGEAVGELAPASNQHERIQTVTLDGAFQVALAGIVQSDMLYTLRSIDSVFLKETALPLDEPLYVYCKETNWNTDSSKIDISIADMVGNVLAYVRGCTFTRNCDKAVYEKPTPIYEQISGKEQSGLSTEKPSLRRFTALEKKNKTRWTHSDGKFTTAENHNMKTSDVLVIPKAFTKAGGIVQCSGIVQDVGKDVMKFKKGDRVLSLNSQTVESQLYTDEDNLVSVGNMTWQSGSAVGLTYGVASHVMNDLMNVKQGDTVFITECQLPVGEACARMANLLGANVMTGTPVTTELPFVKVIDQNALNFSSQVMQMTNDEGIDVIICPQSENVFDELLDCVADDSRMCMINYSIENNLEIVTDDKIMTYCFNMKDMLRRRPDILRDNLVKVLALITDDKLPELQMTSSMIDNSYAESNSKIQTIIIPDSFVPSEVDLPTISLTSKGTYIVTDGFSGVGLEVSRWLAVRGAKHIAIVSQNGRSRNFHKYAVQNLQRHGATVYEICADLSQSGQFTELLEKLQTRTAPDACAIFHTSAASMDNSQANSSSLSMSRILHEESRNLKLDYFVMLSTAVAQAGGEFLAEQAAVTADQAVLAEQMKSERRPALAMQLGPIRGVAHQQADPVVLRTMISSGITPLPMQAYLEQMELLLQTDTAPAVVIVMNKENKSTEGQDCKSLENHGHNNQQTIESQLRAYLSTHLMWPRDLFDNDVALCQYGVDNVIGLELMAWLKEEFDVTLTLKDIADNVTLRDIINKLTK